MISMKLRFRLMTYKLLFREDALKEWGKLDNSIKAQFKKKLKERIEQPRVENFRLSGMQDCYKIKLRNAGYRLVYQVRDSEVIVSVVAVGKREKNAVYKAASRRVWPTTLTKCCGAAWVLKNAYIFWKVPVICIKLTRRMINGVVSNQHIKHTLH